MLAERKVEDLCWSLGLQRMLSPLVVMQIRCKTNAAFLHHEKGKTQQMRPKTGWHHGGRTYSHWGKENSTKYRTANTTTQSPLCSLSFTQTSPQHALMHKLAQGNPNTTTHTHAQVHRDSYWECYWKAEKKQPTPQSLVFLLWSSDMLGVRLEQG